MKAMGFTNRWKQVAGATFGFAALAFTFACNTAPQASSALAQQPQINQAGMPVMVNCEPQQRAVVRPAVVNGVAMSQVDCVAAAPLAVAPVAQPVAYTQPVAYRAPATQYVRPVSNDLGDAQIVPVSTRTVRPVRTNQVVYDERPAPKRSVAKSAIIIGSSAGAGAGVGAAIGGKKGALIGLGVGALAGGSVGLYLDKQRAELEKVAQVKKTENGLLVQMKNDILFDTGSDALKAEGVVELNKMADILAKYSDDRVKIEGHTDAVGDAKHNQALSERRASAVKAVLVSRGVQDKQIEVHGWGELKPIADNASAEGRAKNRRVELHIDVPNPS
jgi:outer membrane protein OmpA-like peptidoglycan-associated protein